MTRIWTAQIIEKKSKGKIKKIFSSKVKSEAKTQKDTTTK